MENDFLDNLPGGFGGRKRPGKASRRRRIKGSAGPPRRVAQPAVTHKVVIYRPVRCPGCNSKKTRAYKTAPKIKGIPQIRYHICMVCGLRFKSVEED